MPPEADPTQETYDSPSGTDVPEGSWKDSLPEGFADAAFFKGAEKPEEVLVAINNAASHMGNSIRVPSEEASDDDRKAFYAKVLEKSPGLMYRPGTEDMDAFYQQLGRPDTADGYIFETPEDRDEPSDLGVFAETAYKHGLSQEQFKGVLQDILGSQWEAIDMAEAEQRDEMEALNDEWGMAFDRNMTQVKNFLRLTDAPEGIVELISEGAMSPTEIKWLHNIATQTKSAVELASAPGAQPDVITPEEARNRIQEMLNNSEHPYWNAADPRHNDAIRKMLDLQRAANPA